MDHILIAMIVSIPAIIGFLTGWLFYFLSLEYLERRTNWTDYTSYGPLIFSKGLHIVKPEGRRYTKWCIYFLGGSAIYLFTSLLLLKLFGLL